MHSSKITVPSQAAEAVRERRECRSWRCGVRQAGSSENIRPVVVNASFLVCGELSSYCEFSFLRGMAFRSGRLFFCL